MHDKLLIPAVWVATVGYAVTGALELFHDQRSPFASPSDYLIEVAFAVGLAGSAAAALALVRAPRTSRAVTIGWSSAALGNLALLCSAAATAAVGHDTLGPAFMLGMLATVVGYATLLVADLRGKVEPARCGIVLLLGFVGSIVLGVVTAALLPHGGGGTLALAAAWAAVARLAGEPRGSLRTA